MRIKLKKFGLIGHLRILLTTLDKDYAEERQDTFFSYLKKSLKYLFRKEDAYKFRIIVENKFAGNIGLFNPKNGTYELGYFILREYRNKGVITKAIEQIIKFAFEKKQIKKIIAITELDNLASQKVLKKNKFKKIKKSKYEITWERTR